MASFEKIAAGFIGVVSIANVVGIIVLTCLYHPFLYTMKDKIIDFALCSMAGILGVGMTVTMLSIIREPRH